MKTINFLKSVFLLLCISSSIMSCNADLKDDIEALEAENEALQEQLNESILGYLKPIKTTHEYSYDTNNPIFEEINFFGLNSRYTTATKLADNLYVIELYTNDNDDDQISIEFYYNTSTGIIESDDIYFNYEIENNIYNNGIQIIYNSDPEEGIDTSITVNSFDTSTGEISITLISEYTADYYSSTYETAGKLTIEFEGTVQLILDEPELTIIG